jgi:1-phosphatidylinositol-4-phosphate 5-kinase
MKNVVGKYKPNILCSYDLKGSTLNREVKLEMEKIQKIVMKDNNFDEIEKYLFIEENDIERLKSEARKAAKFLCKMDIMDYSLLVLKITLTTQEVKNKLFYKYNLI